MPSALVILFLCVLAAVPVTLVVLVGKVTRLRNRTEELEGRINELLAQFAQLKKNKPETESQPIVPAPSHALSELRGSPLFSEESIHPGHRATPPTIPIAPLPTGIRQTPPPPIVPPRSVVSQGESDESQSRNNWEQFLGAKLFAWIGGLALFMGVAFFVKYSFEHNLIPPWVRVSCGFVVGIGLLVAGVLLRKRDYRTLSDTFAATGVVILYAVSFAARSAYGLIGSGALFFCMLGITTTAFVLAVRMNAKVVAVLGIVGGFLTPFLLGAKNDQPFALFGYMLFLNAGLLAVAHYRQWKFLITLGGISSALTATAWTLSSLSSGNSAATLFMLFLISAEYVASYYWTPDQEGESPHAFIGVLAQALAVFLLALILIRSEFLNGHVAVAIFLGDLMLLALLWRGSFKIVLPLAITGTTALLATWILKPGTPANIYLLLGSIVLFSALNGIFPLWIARRRGVETTWSNGAGVAALLLMFVVFPKANAFYSIFWPAVLLINLVLLATAMVRRSLILAATGSVLTVVLTAAWIKDLGPVNAVAAPLLVIGTFAILFFVAAVWMVTQLDSEKTLNPLSKFLPALPAFLPFFLVSMLISQIGVRSPVPLFAFALLMNFMLIGAAFWLQRPEIAAAGLGGTLFLEYCWLLQGLDPSNVSVSLIGNMGFWLIFTAYPFIVRGWKPPNLIPWRLSAAAGPLHFFLIYRAIRLLWPEFEDRGIIPALMALPAFVVLFVLKRPDRISEDHKNGFTAAYGANALFFITLIFPVQFSREWLTVGWALEGAALVWLYRRAPARWLIYSSCGLLTIAFLRLTFNPAVLLYHARGSIPILNWYLYTYGLVAGAMFIAAVLTPDDERIFKNKLRPIYGTFGTILLFLLLNLEIADFFSKGDYLVFEFSGNFARDMTYSIAWSLFALALLLVGVARMIKGVRYAGIALMLVAVAKLFIHDLSQLDQRYRIGAFIGVAIILMVASFIYQRFLASPPASKP